MLPPLAPTERGSPDKPTYRPAAEESGYFWQNWRKAWRNGKGYDSGTSRKYVVGAPAAETMMGARNSSVGESAGDPALRTRTPTAMPFSMMILVSSRPSN